jgi:tetratricopeptide (TPR) repeat protein
MNKNRIFDAFTLMVFLLVLSGCVKEGIKTLPPFDEKVVEEDCAVLIIPHNAKVNRIDSIKRGLFSSWSPGFSTQASLLVPAGEHTIICEYSHPEDGWSAKNLKCIVAMERGKTYMLSIALGQNIEVGTGFYLINEAVSFVRDDIIEKIPFIEYLPRPNPKGLIYQINEIDHYPLEESSYEKEPISKKLLISLVGSLWLFITLIFRFQWHLIFMGRLMNRYAVATLVFSIGLIVSGIFIINYNSSGIFSLYLLSTLLLSLGTAGWDSSNGSNKKGLENLGNKKYEKAVSDFTEAVTIAPYGANFRYNRGIAYCGLQRWKEAIADFTVASQLSPNNAVFKKDLAYAREEFTKSGGDESSVSYDVVDPDNKRTIKITIVIMLIEVITLSIVGHVIRPSYQEMTLIASMTEDAGGLAIFILVNIAIVILTIRNVIKFKNEGKTFGGNAQAHGIAFSVLWWLGTLALLVAGFFARKYTAVDTEGMKLSFGVIFSILGVVAGAIIGRRLAEYEGAGAGGGAGVGAVGFGILSVIFVISSVVVVSSGNDFANKLFMGIVGVIIGAIGGAIGGAILGAILGAIGSAFGIGGSLIGGLLGVLGGGALGALFGIFVNGMLVSSIGAVGAAELVLAGSFGLFNIFSPKSEKTYGEGRRVSLVLLWLVALSVGLSSMSSKDSASATQTAIEAPTPEMLTATVTVNALNFRAGPGTNSTVLKTLKKGSTLTVTGDAQNGWIPVEYEGIQGYVSAELVSIEAE